MALARLHVPADGGSDHPQIGHHARLLMFDDVAMEHPVAGVVGDEGRLGRLAREKEDGIGVMDGQRLMIAGKQLEAVAVDMDRVGDLARIAHPETVPVCDFD